MEGGLLRLLILSYNETHLQHSCPRGENRSKSDWQLKATKSCLQFKLLKQWLNWEVVHLGWVGGEALFCFQVWESGGMEDVQAGVPCTGMEGWIHAGLASQEGHTCYTARQGDEQSTAMQRRGTAPLSNSTVSAVSMQHSCLKPNKVTAIVEKRIPNIQEWCNTGDKHMPGHCKHCTNCISLNEHDECACKSRTAQQHYSQIHFQFWALCNTYLLLFFHQNNQHHLSSSSGSLLCLQSDQHLVLDTYQLQVPLCGHDRKGSSWCTHSSPQTVTEKFMLYKVLHPLTCKPLYCTDEGLEKLKKGHLSQENHVALKEDLAKTLKLKFILPLNPILFFQKWSTL